MTSVTERPLLLLQHADSVFPSGAVSFSWGLEALAVRGEVTDPKSLSDFVTAQIRGRWSGLDRPMLWHAYQADGNMEKLINLDQLMEAQSLGAEFRLGSKQMGRAFVGTHRNLGTPLADRFAELIARDECFGHLAVVQGLLWRRLRFSGNQAIAMSAHGLCTGLLSAAIRLSIVGHLDAQRLHTSLVPVIEGEMEKRICPAEETHSFVPQIEIASMNHEVDVVRLFAN